jgi:hypothetical protein
LELFGIWNSCADLLSAHPSDGDALSSRALTADDLHRMSGDAERRREERDERLVGGAFDRRRGNTNQERLVANARALRFSGAGDDANVELDAAAGLTNQRRPLCRLRNSLCTIGGRMPTRF